MTAKFSSRPDHADFIGILEEQGINVSPEFNLFFDDLFQKLNEFLGDSVLLTSYTITPDTLPDATTNLNGAIIVSDESGGRTMATSDGTDWRRVSDGAVVT